MITRIRLRNFKAFRDQVFTLAPLTLLAGLNGSGKSSLLQSLLLLRQSADLGLLSDKHVALNGDLVHLGVWKDAICESAAEDRITIDLEFDEATRRQWQLSASSPEERIARVDFQGEGEVVTGKNDVLLVRDTASEWNLSPLGEGFRFLSAERVGPRIHYEVPNVETRSSDLGVRGEWAAHYLAVNADHEIGSEIYAHLNGRSLQLAHQAEAWMSEISPGLQLHYERDPSLDLVKLSYSFVARRETSTKYRPTNVGFGVSFTLPIVIAVLSSQPGDLLLLESPEAHLHPRGQGKMAELLSLAASAGVQIIVECHSDHVMNGIRVAVHEGKLLAEQVRFFYFRWNPEDQTGATQVREIRMDKDGRIAEWPDGFFDQFERSLEILLTPKDQLPS